MLERRQHIILSVTNDLVYDRRMDRICSTLAANGFSVTLVGRKWKSSLPVSSEVYASKRFSCWWNHGFLFYAEFNLRLLVWLYRQSFDIVCACDLDTALPVTVVARLQRKRSVLDAHEFFTEVPEIAYRKRIKRFWEWIGKITVPKFDLRYTVGEGLAQRMTEKYKVPFGVIRNIAPSVVPAALPKPIEQRDKILLYQGALNVGRGLEIMLEVMKQLPDWQFWLAGEGDITSDLKAIVSANGLTDRVHFLGWVIPSKLPELMFAARLGINLREKGSLNDYYSLPNKFFDAIQAGLPSVNMKYPEYEKIVSRYPCAMLLEDLHVNSVLTAIRQIDQHPEQLIAMQLACHKAAAELTWDHEAGKLIKYYQDLTSGQPG